jgi:serine/threonine protein kinase
MPPLQQVVGDEFIRASRGNPEQEALIGRMFMAEVRTLGHLHYRNIVRILGYSREADGHTDGLRALVYELLEGGSLHGGPVWPVTSRFVRWI